MRKLSKSALFGCGGFAAIALGLGNVGYSAIYLGNANTGFGGTVGNGNLTMTDDGTNLTMTLTTGNALNDDLVVYVDSVAGGFPDTSLLSDNGDGGRTAISGFNGGNPSRTLVTFPSGFNADYAFSIENGFIGLFGLAAGGNNSLTFITGQGQSGNPNAGSYSITLPLAALGVSAGQQFHFVGTYVSTSAYRSNETIGPSDAPSGNLAFSGQLDFTGSDVYPVPEPASIAVIGGMAMMLGLRRRKA
jgi:hypothetical protein